MRRIGYDIKEAMTKYPHIEIRAIFRANQVILTFTPLSNPFISDPSGGILNEKWSSPPSTPDFKDVQIVLRTDLYPFTAPQITIKDQPYVLFLLTKSSRILKIVQKYSQCLCCKSIVKADNWMPTYQISDILKEIEEMNEIKRTVQYILSLKPISKKYCLPGILEYSVLKYLAPENMDPLLHICL